MGAWIETKICSLKLFFSCVAPYVGAWIETPESSGRGEETIVAPYVGAWIETNKLINYNGETKSLPTWERGLKLLKLNSSQS